MLSSHPQVHLPYLEGTQFLARELDPSSPDANAQLDEYLSLFAAARPEQLVGEVSPSYLRSPIAAGHIARLRPDARIIVILREPSSFIRSLHLELVQDHVEPEKDLRRAIAREQAAPKTQDPSDSPAEHELRYSPERVNYVEHLRRYHAAFPAEQVLVLIYEDFRADNEATVRQVMRFLQLDDSAPIQVTDANPTIGVRSMRMYELVRSLYMGASPAACLARAGIKALTPQRLRRDGLEAFQRRVLWGQASPVDEELMLELRRRSEADVVALSEYLGRDLVALWGYDGLG